MAVRCSKKIDAPLDEVFQAFTDFKNAADRIEAIQRLEVVTDGPVGVGTTFRETRIMFNRECTEEMTISEFEPNKRYVVLAHNCGCEYRTMFEFHPDGDGTRVDVTFNARPQTLFAKLFSPVGKLMSGTMVKLFQKDLDNLETHLRSTTAP